VALGVELAHNRVGGRGWGHQRDSGGRL